MKKKNVAVFLDRDGTLIYEKHYLGDPQKIRFFRGVEAALRQLQKSGWKLIIGTNQAGVGRGIISKAQMHAVNNRLIALLEKKGVKIDALYACPHHPQEGCLCRKPNPGMIQQAAKKFQLDLKNSFVVGDNFSDIAWGKNTGLRAILVLTGYGRKTHREKKVHPDYVVRALPQAAKKILKEDHYG